jgi:hypothetical protein
MRELNRFITFAGTPYKIRKLSLAMETVEFVTLSKAKGLNLREILRFALNDISIPYSLTSQSIISDCKAPRCILRSDTSYPYDIHPPTVDVEQSQEYLRVTTFCHNPRIRATFNGQPDEQFK